MHADRWPRGDRTRAAPIGVEHRIQHLVEVLPVLPVSSRVDPFVTLAVTQVGPGFRGGSLKSESSKAWLSSMRNRPNDSAREGHCCRVR